MASTNRLFLPAVAAALGLIAGDANAAITCGGQGQQPCGKAVSGAAATKDVTPVGQPTAPTGLHARRKLPGRMKSGTLTFARRHTRSAAPSASGHSTSMMGNHKD